MFTLLFFLILFVSVGEGNKLDFGRFLLFNQHVSLELVSWEIKAGNRSDSKHQRGRDSFILKSLTVWQSDSEVLFTQFESNLVPFDAEALWNQFLYSLWVDEQ